MSERNSTATCGIIDFIFKLLFLLWSKRFWEQIVAYADRIENDATINSSLPRKRLYRAVTRNDRGLQRETHRLSPIGQNFRENDASNISYIVACIFFPQKRVKRSFVKHRIEKYNSLSRCLATIGWTHIQIHRLMRGIYEVGRWDRLSYHIPDFIKIFLQLSPVAVVLM
jgi:hypothetical protein